MPYGKNKNDLICDLIAVLNIEVRLDFFYGIKFIALVYVHPDFSDN